MIIGDEAFALATRLARLTGQSVASVVTDALRERLVAAEERERDIAKRRAEIQRLASEIRGLLVQDGGDLPSSDHDTLYDHETGLPI